MNAVKRSAIAVLSAAVVGLIISPAAIACGPVQLHGPLQAISLDPQNPRDSMTPERLARDLSDESSGKAASIVGMWSFQFISEGNTAQNIQDGTQLDFGYNQWHSDGTEVLNSGGRSPAQGNFCLGVWQKTGRYTYQLNHFALNYDAKTGTYLGKLRVVENVTLSPGGASYSGTFVYSVYDTNGNKVTAFTGQTKADRITLDTATP